MYLIKKVKVLFIFSILFLNFQNLNSLENKILFKVDNEIITTMDIFEEIKFLKAFNPEMNNLKETELIEISKNLILRNIIKKIELRNIVEELKVDDKFLSKLIISKYSKIGIDSFEKFEIYLNDKNLDIKLIKEKFTIELIWNDYIYQKFSKKVVIDKEKIKREILQNPQKENQREFLLSEINFNATDKTDLKSKYKRIISDIEKLGFKKTALKHSNSESASNGGLIGWVKEDNLNLAIKEIISELKIGQVSRPIRTSSGFIILKIEDEKLYVSKLNINEKVEEIIKFKTNDQLSQFSKMYFNKIKKNKIINEL
tara:strand:+ start:101 stop:1042 length:942 start_codon:yes stop_codon:yes gene_type:complete